MNILVIGEACKDVFHYGKCGRLCPDAPVPVFGSIHIVENDGMAKNVQRNLDVLGANVKIITNKNWSKITKTRFVDLRSNHMFLRVDEGDKQFVELKQKVIDEVDFEDYDAVIISDYDKGFLSESVLEQIAAKHPFVFLDTKKILGDWCEKMYLIKINNMEFEATKHTLTNSIYEKLIITRGQYGSEFQDKIYPVPSVEIKDTSGAGDTFIASLCYKFIKTKNIYEAIKFANQCATKVVQKRGVSTV